MFPSNSLIQIHIHVYTMISNNYYTDESVVKEKFSFFLNIESTSHLLTLVYNAKQRNLTMVNKGVPSKNRMKNG